MSDLDVVAEFIAAFNRNDLDDILGRFDENAVYHNMPMEPVQGHGAIRAVLEGFMGMAEEVDWVVHHAADAGNGVVLNERLDRFRIKGQWLELPVMGTFEVADGRIVAWRDYFDLNQFQSRMAQIQGGA